MTRWPGSLIQPLFGMILLSLPAAGFAEGLPWTVTQGQGIFLLMSDVHFDPYADPALVKKLAAASVDQWEALFESSTLKAFATYDKDANYPIFKSALQEASALGSYDYALVSGDLISHHFKQDFKSKVGGDDKAYQAFVLKTIVFVSREIQKTLAGVPVYFCLGNNDSDYDDYGGLIPGSPFLPTLAKEWATVANDPQAVQDFSQGGYYVVPHPTLPGHEIVVLNDVCWSAKYEPSPEVKRKASSDAGSAMEDLEMGWLKKVMEKARTGNLKVTIETHMPPGINGRNASVHEDRTKPQHTFYNQAYLWPFLNLLASCRDLIDAEFTGHTHMDDFRLVEDRGGKPVFFAHITPAVSPVHHNNPGFQVMLYDRKDGTYQDLATYELPLAGKGDPTVPSWKLEYSFRDAYGAKAYNFASLQALEGAIEQDPQVRAKYIQYVTVSCTDAPPATMDDWKFFSCAHLNLDPQSYMDCYR